MNGKINKDEFLLIERAGLMKRFVYSDQELRELARRFAIAEQNDNLNKTAAKLPSEMEA